MFLHSLPAARRVSLLCAGLAVASLLNACGAFLAVRAGRTVISDRNKQLLNEREATWLALWPVLRASCQALAAELPAPPALPLNTPKATMLFNTRGLAEPDDNALLPPPALLKGLALAGNRRGSLAEGELPATDYVVGWRRQPLHSDWPGSLTQLEMLALQVRDRNGQLLAQEGFVGLNWLGALQTEYLRCDRVLKPADLHPVGERAPDFIFLKEVFGARIGQSALPPGRS